jgi:SPP1 gp7 family putative phage head morphogenesis protein
MGQVLSIYTLANRYDPTHTTALRNAFAANMNNRFTELSSVIYKSVKVNDCFGLRKPDLTLHQMNPALPEAFNFIRSSKKIEAFMAWLDGQVKKGILDIRIYEQVGQAIDSAWTNMYVEDSYKRGIARARQELQAAGINVPSLDSTGGINSALNNPFHMDRLGLIFTRVFTDLKGITANMDTIISRILAQGIADGDGPELLARKLLSSINGTGADRLGITDTIGRFIPAKRRAMILARTEIIRAHHLATIQEYRNWGLLNIKVKGEFTTAGDDRVCSRCASLDGKIFTLDEIENMIPQHPDCRCIALPWIEEIKQYY